MLSHRLVKSLVVIALIGVVASSVGWAQTARTARHDVSLSYGVVSMDQITDALTDILTVVFTFGTYAKERTSSSGVPFFTYHFSPRGRFGFGLAAGGYMTKGNLEIADTASGTFKETNYVGAFEIAYRWIMKTGFQMYSGLGGGGRIRKGTYTVEGEETETTSKVLPTFHVNLLGFRFGRAIGFFGELGFGYKGLLNFGLSAQF